VYRRFDEYDRSGITGPVEDPPGGGDPLPPRILGQKWLDITWAWDPSASLAQLITGFEVGVAVGPAPGQDPWLVAPFTVPASDRRAVRAVSLASDLTTAHACVRPLYGAQAGPWTVQGVAQSVAAVPVPVATLVQVQAAQAAANAANAALADIASDGKLTPSEKQSTRLQWDTILGERAGIQSRADAVSVSRTDYDSAFQALATYLNAGTTWSSGTPSWLADANLSTTTPIDGPTFRANWKALFDARQALLNAITAAVQAAANTAQTAANSAQTAANNAATAASYADRLARSSNNLIKNANSEDPDPTGYEAAVVYDTTYDSYKAYTGTKVRRTVTEADGFAACYMTEEIPCAPGDQHVIEAMVRNISAVGQVHVGMRYMGPSGTTGWGVKGAQGTPNAWTRTASSGTAPAGTTSVSFYIDHENAGVGGALAYYDCLYATRKVSAGMLEADILKAMLIKGEVIETPNYVPGSAGVAPVGVKISGVPFAATLKDGSTLQVNMELGASASIGGERVQAILDAMFANQAEFQAGQSGTWTAPKSGWLEVLMCGGGGSGAHSTDGSFPVCGGGGAGVLKYTIWVAKGQQIPYSVGSGGLGVTNTQGNNGGDTTFGAATAKGGKRGGVSSTVGGPGGAVIPPTSLGGQIAGAAAGVSTSITTGFDVLAACPGAGGGNATTYGGGTTWFAPWTSGDNGTGGSSGLGRGGQSGTAPTGYGAGSGGRKNTSSASLPGGPGYLRLRW